MKKSYNQNNLNKYHKKLNQYWFNYMMKNIIKNKNMNRHFKILIIYLKIINIMIIQWTNQVIIKGFNKIKKD